MPASSSFNPLRFAKRKLQPYDPLPGGNSYADEAHDEYDLEKHSPLDGLHYEDTVDDPFPAHSSSGVLQPLSQKPPTSQYRQRSNSRVRKASMSINTNVYPHAHRVSRRRFSRWFALALGGAVVFFIVLLSAQGRRSHLAIETGLMREPDPPAPWEAFPFLQRYHGGIRTLVPRSENKPEYPGEGFNVSELLGYKKDPAEKEKRDATEALEDERTKDHHLPAMQVFSPYPAYASDAYKKDYTTVKTCYLDDKRTQRVPQLRVYPGVVQGTPDHVLGSYEIFGLRNDVCFDRFGRLGPYGLGYSRKMGGSGAAMEGDREGAEQVWKDDPEVDYREVHWADVQERCARDNAHRFKPAPQTVPHGSNHFYFAMDGTASGNWKASMPMPEKVEKRDGEATTKSKKSETEDSGEAMPVRVVDSSKGASLSTVEPPSARKLLPRNAVIIRTWHDFHYDDEDLFYLRALVTELSVNSGGEYTVHFLIHVKDNNLPIWSDEGTYQRVLNDSLPEEFRGMGTLWTERQMELLYGGMDDSHYRDLPVYGAYRSTMLPVQHFAHMHPEFDFFWHWEMDVRYTGHFYELFDKVGAWARKQPRKGLWERNARFYVPREHGDWEDFKHMVRVQTEHGTSSKNNIWAAMENNPDVPDEVKAQAVPRAEKPIWGPERSEDDEMDTDGDPEPPRAYADDKFEWGVGEDADLITFNPLFDPTGTNWILAGDVTGYNTSRTLPPRRTAIITAGRLSRRLLETMHRETAVRRRTMFSEMWPASVALQHGLKAVYAPHPVFIDRAWPTDYLAAIFNGGRNGAAGGARTSVFSDERQHNFRGTTWYYNSGAAPNLWLRWLGYVVDNDGGEEDEVWGEGRMCLPPVLLHPVKHVDLVFAHEEGEV
ncbi:uncharacterized protein K452DRAFT_287079 [Aplosporella prunicola CBS 121167]|uniref:Uncharacterized protein n=1 Tax=Aplosporella prunicola CBS 121167 TaxID=1176127 RepID=A0A6A6BES5_9PEZI|nr:uncharacterized protein K452DRAFT_287079 [Aplosporella prunicola CBS 121167]KAF2142669.1 hypothetical protein K452DRAFT_287079 [Aplosporella prunicola CBS 121167]